MMITTAERKRLYSVDGVTFKGSVEAGEALKSRGFVYSFSTEGNTFYYHKHHKTIAAIVDGACNQHGYKVELTTREDLVDIALHRNLKCNCDQVNQLQCDMHGPRE